MRSLYLNIVCLSGALVLFGGWVGNLANYTFDQRLIYLRDISLILCLLVFFSMHIHRYIPKKIYFLCIITLIIFLNMCIKMPYDVMGVAHFGYRNLIFWLSVMLLFSIAPASNKEKTFDVIFYTLSSYICLSLLFFAKYNYFGRNFGFLYNPNIFGNFTILVIFYHLINIYHSNNRMLNTVFAALASISLVLSGSFTSFIMLLTAMIFCVFAFNIFRNKDTYFYSLLLTATFLISYFTGLLAYPIQRFYDVSANTSTISGRISQYSDTFALVSDLDLIELLFGFALYDKYKTFDSFYIQLIVNHGIVGLLSVLTLLLYVAILLRKSVKIYDDHYGRRVATIVKFIYFWYLLNLVLGFSANSFLTKFPFNAIFALLVGTSLSIFTRQRSRKLGLTFLV